MRIRVLGPLEATVVDDERAAVDLGGRRQRALLARLVIARGMVVSVDRLVEDLWAGKPTPSAVGALQVHISHLRRVLEPEQPARSRHSLLSREARGYALRLPSDAVDAWRFEELVTDNGRRAVPQLQQALELWNGSAFGEFADESWAVADVARLDELRTTTREQLAAVLLAEGRFVDAARVAGGLIDEHPLREEAWRIRALALYGSGRQADALAALRRARELIVEELGVDPSSALRAVERDILTNSVDMPVPQLRAEPPASPPAHLLSGGFVGRQDQLGLLQSAAQHAEGERSPAFALVVGDPGAGKSTLLDRFAADLAADGWTVVRARCLETGEAPPGWPWIQVAEVLGAGLAPVPDRLKPLLQTDPFGSALDAAYGRFSLRRGLGELLTTAGSRRPLALLIDDLHRADPLTLDLLAGVAEDVSGVPLLAVGSTRPSWFGTEIPTALAAMQQRALRVAIPAFDREESARIIRGIAGEDTDAATVSALVDRTGGNAFYLTESARLLRSEGAVVATAQVPDGVRDVLRRRLSLLPDDAVEVLRLAAVIGRDIDIEVLERTAEFARSSGGAPKVGSSVERPIDGALDAGLRAGLLIEHRLGTVQFAHIVVRETLYDDIPVVRRSRWHAAVSDALLELRNTDIAARAAHLARSGTMSGARAAVDAAAAAADQAMARYAPERAAELYEQALQALARLVPQLDIADPPLIAEQVGLLARRSRAQLAAGAGAAALDSRAAAVDAAERLADDQLLVSALTAWDLVTPWTTRPYGAVDRHLIAAIERSLRVPDVSPLQRSKLLCVLVREVAGDDQPRATQAAQEAEKLARQIGDPVLIGLALHARGAVLLHDSDLVARLPLADELLQIGEQPGLAMFALIGHEFFVQWAVTHAEPDALTTHLGHLEALVRTYRWRQGAAVVAMHRGVRAHLLGELADAEHAYRQGIELLRKNGGLDLDWIATISLFSVAVSAGRVGDLLPALDALRPFPPATVDLVAVVLAAAGRAADAVEVRRHAPPIPHDFFRSLRLTGRALALIELAGVELDAAAEAADLYAELLEFAGQLGGAVTGAFAFPPVDMLLGDLARLLGRSDAARIHYDAAAAIIARCGSPIWSAALAGKRRALSHRHRHRTALITSAGAVKSTTSPP